MPSSPSVQLYTARDAVAEDLQGPFARLVEIGFTKVEPYAFVERAARVNELQEQAAATRVVEFDGYRGDIFSGVAASFAWLEVNDK